jgi:hypothetical protein
MNRPGTPLPAVPILFRGERWLEAWNSLWFIQILVQGRPTFVWDPCPPSHLVLRSGCLPVTWAPRIGKLAHYFCGEYTYPVLSVVANSELA